MTSNEQKNQSREELDEATTDSVFDFFYYDARRIASFLSQFNNSGHLKEIVLDQSARRAKQNAGSIKATGGIPLALSGEGVHTTESSAMHQNRSQRIYDPTWTNARLFLDTLDEMDMINRSITTANMGQFVLCSGNLSIADLKLMEQTWKLKSIQAVIKSEQGVTSGNRQQRRAKGKTASEPTNNIDLVIEMLSIMPHTIQAKISGVESVWCSLSEEGMSAHASDITLKHGMNIPGTWHAVGILDAKPEGVVVDDNEPDFGDGQELGAKLMTVIAPITRQLLGRPEDHFGITPLLIFREIESNE